MEKLRGKERRKNERKSSMKLAEKRCFAAVCMLLLALVVDNITWAAESDIVSKDEMNGEEQAIREVDKFDYELENRADPFLPFLSQDNSRDDKDDDVPINTEGGKPLTRMQLFEPGQLKLVGLFKIGNRNIAMAEDVTGKGYRLDEKMLIGRYGVINRIRNEQVEITESYKTKSGRIVTKEIVMRLKKEGEK